MIVRLSLQVWLKPRSNKATQRLAEARINQYLHLLNQRRVSCAGILPLGLFALKYHYLLYGSMTKPWLFHQISQQTKPSSKDIHHRPEKRSPGFYLALGGFGGIGYHGLYVILSNRGYTCRTSKHHWPRHPQAQSSRLANTTQTATPSPNRPDAQSQPAQHPSDSDTSAVRHSRCK